ncbi:MAG: ATP-binding protein [Erysipelotrichaceae bacterium]|nr:ATP-binding protein [Erysipelotrichaceae bacterium]MBQ5555893.1 ATP-binding protein [Erysipelotrichaceae bacterium]
MEKIESNLQIIKKLMFKLLPIQILLAMISAINGIVSGYFASNFVGYQSMSAIGLYGPIATLIGSLAFLFSGGSAIICGKYLGRNDKEKLQEVFSLDMLVSFIASIVMIVIFVGLILFGGAKLFTSDEVLQPLFGKYLAGQAVGLIPTFIGGQLPVFLSMENKSRRTFVSSLVYIAVNLVLNYLFVTVLGMEELGLALASSLGMWVYTLVLAQYYFTKGSLLKFTFKKLNWSRCKEIVRIGFPGSATYIYQAGRGLIVNKLLEIHTGSIGLSAFASANNLLGVFWAIPSGMAAVSRLLMSISVGEEDRHSLVDIMRVMFRYYVPLMCAIDVVIILFASPLAGFYFFDPASEVHQLTANCLRILPLCMPLSLILLHFLNFGQAFDKQVYVNTLSVIDGIVDVAVFSFLLIGPFGVNGVCIANVLNGVVTTLYIIGYAWFMNKRMPKSVEDLMVIPDNFGAKKEDRLDFSVKTIEEVLEVSRRVQNFCLERGIDAKKAYLAGLAMEEMAGNIVEHGFIKDKKKHSIDIRVVNGSEDVILRLKDDCIPFDPKERSKITANDDPTKNIGIRMIYKIMKDVNYQNLLGLNVLTVRI